MAEINYQDSNWSVPELEGKSCIQLFGLTYEESDYQPEMLFLELSDGRWHRCYLDVFIGFWNETRNEYLDTIIDCDYEGSRKIDYLKKFDLGHPVISKIWCDRNIGSTFISIDFGLGIVVFRKFDEEEKCSEIDFVVKNG